MLDFTFQKKIMLIERGVGWAERGAVIKRAKWNI